MKIAFFTNFINHHQVPVADELYKIMGSDYIFVATESIPQSFKDNGYPDYSDKPYLLEAFREENKQLARQIAFDADVVIIGSASDSYIEDRLKENKITFRYNERWFKTGYRSLISPRSLYYYYRNHARYRKGNLYMLCASAYTANDVSKIFAYPSKCFKWGYFTSVRPIDIDSILTKKRASTLKILWVARFLKLKHPEMMLQLAKMLKDMGYNVEINMIGNGPEYDNIKAEIIKSDLGDTVHLLGQFSNSEIHKIMQQHHIFCFTSDKNEGWGAVLNEAMSNGCAVVASNTIGSVPFLVKNKENGLIFKSEDVQSLFDSVKLLLDNHQYREKISKNAYYTMYDVWNPCNAAKNLLTLIESLKSKKACSIKYGPCSVAHKINANEII